MLSGDATAIAPPGDVQTFLPSPAFTKPVPVETVIPSARTGLWAITKRVYAEFSDDRIPTVAGGVTFFALLALFPAIASVVSLYGLFAHRADIRQDLDMISGFLPGGAVSIVQSELHRLTQQKRTTLNFAFLTSSAVALWSASGGFKALVEGLNIAFEVRETRSFLRLSLHALGFTAAATILAVVAINLGLVVPLLATRLPHAPLLRLIAAIALWLLSFAACNLLIALIYRFAPDRRPMDCKAFDHAPPGRKGSHWRWSSWGSAIAAACWLIGTQLFSWYAQNFGSYNRIYGDLGAAVGFLTWIWLSLVILLLGAEIDCELARRAAARRA